MNFHKRSSQRQVIGVRERDGLERKLLEDPVRPTTGRHRSHSLASQFAHPLDRIGAHSGSDSSLLECRVDSDVVEDRDLVVAVRPRQSEAHEQAIEARADGVPVPGSVNRRPLRLGREGCSSGPMPLARESLTSLELLAEDLESRPLLATRPHARHRTQGLSQR